MPEVAPNRLRHKPASAALHQVSSSCYQSCALGIKQRPRRYHSQIDRRVPTNHRGPLIARVHDLDVTGGESQVIRGATLNPGGRPLPWSRVLRRVEHEKTDPDPDPSPARGSTCTAVPTVPSTRVSVLVPRYSQPLVRMPRLLVRPPPLRPPATVHDRPIFAPTPCAIPPTWTLANMIQILC